MTEYAKYTLNIRKIGIIDTELEKKLKNIFLVVSILLGVLFIIFIDFVYNHRIWMDILWLILICPVPFLKTLLERKRLLLKGEVDLEVKRDNFYFYKDEVMKLELLYKNTDVSYRKTIFGEIKLIMNSCGKIYYFYVKKDHNISGYEKLYTDLERTEYHKKLSLLKESVFYIAGLVLMAAYILFG